jgi:hypothetical protein
MWGAVSGDRTGLSFTIVAGARQRSHSRVRFQWDSRPYFIVLDSRLPFSVSVASYDSKGYGGRIRPHLHTGATPELT